MAPVIQAAASLSTGLPRQIDEFDQLIGYRYRECIVFSRYIISSVSEGEWQSNPG